MVFSSLLFLFVFLAVTLALYYLIPNRVYRNVVLLVLSLFFYGWGEPVYLLLMIFSIILNYVSGLLVEKFRDNKKKAKAVLAVAVIINLLMLGVFKYTGFVVDTLKAIFPFMRSFATPIIPLPIGISFYTFQAMSYVIDVYRRQTRVQKNPVYFGTYVSLFPQLIAGPIVRYKDVADQLEDRRESLDQFISGAKLFCIGLAQKVLIANQVAAFWEQMKGGIGQYGVLAVWLGVIANGFQLYFDFGGYSNMAIGLGRMFGFEFLKNFNYPFIADSVSDFWRRWHISLGTWFKEYVYFPLGGSKKGFARMIFNTFIVWFLTGLWHGANWNYALWGLYFGTLIIIEKLFLGKILEKWPKWARHIYLLIIVTFSWPIFDFNDLGQLWQCLVGMFNGYGAGFITHDGLVYILAYLPVLILAGVAATPLAKNIHDRFKDKPWCGWVDVGLVLCSLGLCTASLVASGYNPFIYFRF